MRRRSPLRLCPWLWIWVRTCLLCDAHHRGRLRLRRWLLLAWKKVTPAELLSRYLRDASMPAMKSAPPPLRISPLRITFEHQIRFTPAEPANPVNVHRDLMRLLSSFVAIRAGTVSCGIHDPAPRHKRIRGSAHHLVSTLRVGFDAGSRRTTGKCSNDSNCHCVSHATSGRLDRILPHRAKREAGTWRRIT
jgi:hypothetical protein